MGLINFKNIEFFSSPEGVLLFQTDGSNLRELTETEYDLVNFLFDRIRIDYTEAYQSLSAEYNKSLKSQTYFKFLCVSRFIRCNMSNFDTLSIDIDIDNFFHFEQVNCPMRGECKLYKIVCSPKFNSNLTKMEERILDIYCEPKEMEDIANELYLSIHTIETHIRNIRKKTGCHSKPELMKYNSIRKR